MHKCYYNEVKKTLTDQRTAVTNTKCVDKIIIKKLDKYLQVKFSKIPISQNKNENNELVYDKNEN